MSTSTLQPEVLLSTVREVIESLSQQAGGTDIDPNTICVTISPSGTSYNHGSNTDPTAQHHCAKAAREVWQNSVRTTFDTKNTLHAKVIAIGVGAGNARCVFALYGVEQLMGEAILATSLRFLGIPVPDNGEGALNEHYRACVRASEAGMGEPQLPEYLNRVNPHLDTVTYLFQLSKQRL